MSATPVVEPGQRLAGEADPVTTEVAVSVGKGNETRQLDVGRCSD